MKVGDAAWASQVIKNVKPNSSEEFLKRCFDIYDTLPISQLNEKRKDLKFAAIKEFKQRTKESLVFQLGRITKCEKKQNKHKNKNKQTNKHKTNTNKQI